MNFKAELLNGSEVVDYMIFEKDTLQAAIHYAQERFKNAYPHIEGIIKITAA